METVLRGQSPYMLFLFKSYYVVWKRDIARFLPVSLRMFKSYYVVWKQNRIKINKMVLPMFKSYYVVWKLPDFRTLQYAHTRV